MSIAADALTTSPRLDDETRRQRALERIAELDDHRTFESWCIRVAGTLAIAAGIVACAWVAVHVDPVAPWFSLPFLVGSILMTGCLLLVVANNWRRISLRLDALDVDVDVPDDIEVVVAIPTVDEDIGMVVATVRSVLDQHLPSGRVLIIVSDDGHRQEMRDAVLRIFTPRNVTVLYFEPPRRGNPRRRGVAKAGNLNAVFDWVVEQRPGVRYLETRDCDDLVGDVRFLSSALAVLERDPKSGWVQSIKGVRRAGRDPFSNVEAWFFRGMMVGRNGRGTVPACGSGLVWRVDALRTIGGFSAWNLVEDIQTSFDLQRRGWRSRYLPMVGALAQHAPSDLANAYKQRGMWCVDALRMLLWSDKAGLTPRVASSFLLDAYYYLLAPLFTVWFCMTALALGFRIYPLDATSGQWLVWYVPFIALTELTLWTSKGRDVSTAEYLRSRRFHIGLLPFYLVVVIRAVVRGGERPMPKYHVTRKSTQEGLFLTLALPQLTLITLLVAAGWVSIARGDSFAETGVMLYFAAYAIIGCGWIVWLSCRTWRPVWRRGGIVDLEAEHARDEFRSHSLPQTAAALSVSYQDAP